jgi:hypothetical protein
MRSMVEGQPPRPRMNPPPAGGLKLGRRRGIGGG